MVGNILRKKTAKALKGSKKKKRAKLGGNTVMRGKSAKLRRNILPV